MDTEIINKNDKIRILIVEDELIIAEDMRLMLENLDYEVIDIASNYREAENSAKKNNFDLALIDINLNGNKDGITFAEFLNKYFKVPFVFITSYADQETVNRAKVTLPGGYLVKPFDRDDLFTSIEIALNNFVRGEVENFDDYIIKDALFVRENRSYTKVKFNEIIWINADDNYIHVHRANKRFLIRSSLKDFEKRLPPDMFFRTHKSYIVNLKFIDSINSSHVVVATKPIPISRNYKELLLQKLNKI